MKTLTNDDSTIVTWKGHKIDLLTGPTLEQVDIEDIAHHLSMQCRFVGAVNRFYSIGEHSIYAGMLASRMYAIYFLLHDVHEYIYHDLTSPLKKLLFKDNPLYKKLCDQCDKTIIETLGYSYTQFQKLKSPSIKAVDEVLCDLEKQFLKGINPPDPNFEKSHPLHGMPFGMSQQDAKKNFLQFYFDAKA